MVLSPDTDVFELLLFYWDVLHKKGIYEPWLKAGSRTLSNIFQYILLRQIKGMTYAMSFPLIGCGYTSKVGKKHATLKANPVDYLQGFGCRSSDDELERAESYLVIVQRMEVQAACNSGFSSGVSDFHDLLTSGQHICVILT